MCPVCEEFGRLVCPACEAIEETPETFRCKWCGESFPEEDGEGILYKGEYYCRKCYECEKEAGEAVPA
jgi:hypothetical protein